MCVIVYKKRKARISELMLRDMWNANPDGAGIAFKDGANVVIIKGLMTKTELLKTVEEFKDKALLIHFRLATAGRTDWTNTHPFRVQDAAIVHNGILSEYSGDKELSDTALFCKEVLEPMEQSKWGRVLRSVGSKWAIMSPEGIKMIGKFEKYKGLWVSNTHWEFGRYLKPQPSKNLYLPKWDEWDRLQPEEEGLLF